jgi:hypothetical protein
LTNHPLTGPYNSISSGGFLTRIAQSDYAANGGVQPGDYAGAFIPYGYPNFNAASYTQPKLRTFDDFRDGQSNTILLGEKLINRALANETICQQPDDCFGYTAGWHYSTVRFGIGPPQQDLRAGNSGGRFGSAHVSNALMAFADGSVRSVSYTVNPTIMAALCHLSDGLSFSDSDY